MLFRLIPPSCLAPTSSPSHLTTCAITSRLTVVEFTAALSLVTQRFSHLAVLSSLFFSFFVCSFACCYTRSHTNIHCRRWIVEVFQFSLLSFFAALWVCALCYTVFLLQHACHSSQCLLLCAPSAVLFLPSASHALSACHAECQAHAALCPYADVFFCRFIHRHLPLQLDGFSPLSPPFH